MNGQAKSYYLRFSLAMLGNFLQIMKIFFGLHFSVFLREDSSEYPNDETDSWFVEHFQYTDWPFNVQIQE